MNSDTHYIEVLTSLKLQSMGKLIRKGNRIISKESENIINSCLNNETN